MLITKPLNASVWPCSSSIPLDRRTCLVIRLINIFIRVRMITNSALDTLATPPLANIGLRSISELKQNELKLITFKSLNDLAPNYLRQLLITNSQQSFRALRNNDRNLKFPLKKANNGQKGYSFRGGKCGMVSQLVPNVHHLWHLLSHICK